jgi:hypothetical protein
MIWKRDQAQSSGARASTCKKMRRMTPNVLTKSDGEQDACDNNRESDEHEEISSDRAPHCGNEIVRDNDESEQSYKKPGEVGNTLVGCRFHG